MNALFSNEYRITSLDSKYFFKNYLFYGHPYDPDKTVNFVTVYVPFVDKNGVKHESRERFYFRFPAGIENQFKREFGVELLPYTRKKWETLERAKERQRIRDEIKQKKLQEKEDQ